MEEPALVDISGGRTNDLENYVKDWRDIALDEVIGLGVRVGELNAM